MTAPATAPTGPKTTAPDNAPNAASPTRSPANVADGTHQIAIRAATTVFFMLRLPASMRVINSDFFISISSAKIGAVRAAQRACEYHERPLEDGSGSKPMSALGQKQTHAVQHVVSALPP